MLHATCLAIGGQGVLLLGASGTGKSDLALRLIDQPGLGVNGTLKTAVLVSDDQVLIRCRGTRLTATAPPSIAGKMEVRGLGIVTLPICPSVDLALAVQFAATRDIERLPDPDSFAILGCALPRILLDPASASAPARVRAALDWLGRR